MIIFNITKLLFYFYLQLFGELKNSLYLCAYITKIMWKEIKNGYQISNEGILKNSKGKVIVGFINNTGYRRVSIWSHS